MIVSERPLSLANIGSFFSFVEWDVTTYVSSQDNVYFCREIMLLFRHIRFDIQIRFDQMFFHLEFRPCHLTFLFESMKMPLVLLECCSVKQHWSIAFPLPVTAASQPAENDSFWQFHSISMRTAAISLCRNLKRRQCIRLHVLWSYSSVTLICHQLSCCLENALSQAC